MDATDAKRHVRIIVWVHVRVTARQHVAELQKAPHVQVVPTTVRVPAKTGVKKDAKTDVGKDVKTAAKKGVKTAVWGLAQLPVKALQQGILTQARLTITTMLIWV